MKHITDVLPDVAKGSCPLEGLATSGQPAPEDFGRLSRAGFKTVLDLRTPGEPRGFEEPEAVRSAGMEYVSLPVGSEPPEDSIFDRFREMVRDIERRPMLVHCASANRVGALLIPYLVLDEGRTTEEALSAAAGVGLRSEDLREAALRYASCRAG